MASVNCSKKHLQRIPYVRIGLQLNTFGRWDWGVSRWPYTHILSPKISSATTRDLPWQPDIANDDRSSVKATGVLSVCVNDYSSPKNCRSGLIEASPNEEFPVLCQFDLGKTVWLSMVQFLCNLA